MGGVGEPVAVQNVTSSNDAVYGNDAVALFFCPKSLGGVEDHTERPAQDALSPKVFLLAGTLLSRRGRVIQIHILALGNHQQCILLMLGPRK